jgi:DUF2924 family protein
MNGQEVQLPLTENAWTELPGLTTSGLKKKYLEVFGEESRSSNKQYLVRRIAWRMQADVQGGLSEQARQRIVEIADDRDLRTRVPADFSARDAWARARSRHDWRIPRPGTLLTRRFNQRQIVVKVLDDGFEYESRQYPSLSAIAREVTGTRWNGLLFFGLTERRHE